MSGKGKRTPKPPADPPLVDETALLALVGKLSGLEIELAQLRIRVENYERGILLLARIREVLHRNGIVTAKDMAGLDDEFEAIPGILRRMEVDRDTFITPLPTLEHK